MCVCVCVCVYIYIYVCVCVCVYVCVCVCVCVYIYIYIYIYISVIFKRLYFTRCIISYIILTLTSKGSFTVDFRYVKIRDCSRFTHTKKV